MSSEDIRRGRPTKEKPKQDLVRVTLNITREEYQRLCMMSYDDEKNKSDIVRQGLEMRWNLHKIRH